MSEPHTRQIYIAMPDWGHDSWQRVDAISEGGDAYRIVSVNPDPSHPWEYATGELVRCRPMALPSGERVLVATQRVETPPPPAAT